MIVSPSPPYTALAGCAVAALALGSCAEVPSSAANYPSGVIRIVTPFAAGGISDTTARVAASCLEESLGGNFIVENQDGGGGVVGMTRVANAAPDGSILSVVSVSTAALVPLVTEGAGYGGSSFDAVSGITLSPSVFVVSKDSPIGNIDELFAAAEEDDGDFSVAMPGSLGIFALTTDGITEAGGPGFTKVPFESNDQSAAAVLGGNVDSAYLSTSPTLLQQIESGDLRVLATGAKERLDYLPDVPTLAEAGYDDLPDSTVNVVLVGPSGLDDDVQGRLSEAMGTCLEEPGTSDVLGEEFVRTDEPGPGTVREEIDNSETQWREAVGR